MITVYESPTRTEDPIDKKRVIRNKEKKYNPTTLSPHIEEFIRNFKARLNEKENIPDESKVNVSEAFGGIALAYEKIRTAIEYKGESVLRRNAIERILKRLIWEHGDIKSDVNSESIAETLTRELIWARYIPNNTIPEKDVVAVTKIIDKYVYILKNIDGLPSNTSVPQAHSWIWGIASSEIEDTLDPSNRELYVRLMYDWFLWVYDWKDEKLSEHDKNMQIYLAVHRAYTKSDDQIMRYHLLLQEVPEWASAKKNILDQFINKFAKVFSEIETHLHYPGRFVIYRVIQKQVAAFEIFHTIVKEEDQSIEALLSDRSAFSQKISSVCKEKYNTIRDKVTRGVARSIVYIFITKIFVALLIEVPYEILKFSDLRTIPLTINILLPPLLMWFIGLTIKPPSDKNTELIIKKLTHVIYDTEPHKVDSITVKPKKRTSLTALFSISFILISVTVFAFLSYLLLKIGFTYIGIILFFGFVSLVLLFALRIRYNAQEIKLEDSREGTTSYLFDFLTLPFISLGYYLSKGLSVINVFTVIFDFLIEAPLKSILELVNQWVGFIKDKRSEVIELPE